VRIIKEPAPAGGSQWVNFIERHGVASPLVIAHVRHASVGSRAFSNTHPFARELGGCMHVFAHNGTLPELRQLPLQSRAYRPVGSTDSEHAFCLLLERLAPLWGDAGRPSVRERRVAVARFAADMAALGPANFLYSDGELLFAHGHRRPKADGRVEPPGLYFIERKELPPPSTSWLASGVRLGEPVEPVAIVASVPLTDEAWLPLEEGELLVLSRGRLLAF
jgi:glutamine amidotransferase